MLASAENLEMTMGVGDESCQALVDLLRLELQEYGALLSLLKAHQRNIIERNSHEIVELNDAIDKQVRANAHVRDEREQYLKRVCPGVEGESAPLRAFMRVLPENLKHLFQALYEEICSVVTMTQAVTRQNHILIKRAIESTEDLLNHFAPNKATKTYGKNGKVSDGRPKSINRLNLSA